MAIKCHVTFREDGCGKGKRCQFDFFLLAGLNYVCECILLMLSIFHAV